LRFGTDHRCDGTVGFAAAVELVRHPLRVIERFAKAPPKFGFERPDSQIAPIGTTIDGVTGHCAQK